MSRTCWLEETVKVDGICNSSCGIDEGLHEGLELKLLGVGNLKSHQLLFFDFLAMNADE